jgi:hypothetical protein
MSYLTHQSFGDETCNPEARGSGVWASRDPKAATSGQAATATHTPGRQSAPTPCQPDRIQVPPSPGRSAWSTDAADSEASRQPPHYRSAEMAAEGGISTAHTGRHAHHRIPGLRRAGPQGPGGVSVAVPELSQPDPRTHHDGLPRSRHR